MEVPNMTVLFRKRRALPGLGLLVLALTLGLVPGAAGPPAGAAPAAQIRAGVEALPPGASIETVLTDLNSPVAMAFDPGGRLFYTERASGRVRLYANGKVQPAPVINFDVSNCSERGLLGIAIDPDFTANHYIYVYYTQGPGCETTENKVARFVERDGVGSSPVVLFTSPQTAGNHNGGNIHFGPDGKLYITIGESANPSNSQNMRVPNGKLHRINPDGSIPADNPNFGAGALRSIYAVGLRNSFDFTFDPVVHGRIFASENGPGCDDEMNRIERGGNYGWRPGYPCDDATPDPAYNSNPPLWFAPAQFCCVAPTGITVYTGNQIPQWHNHLFMANYQDPPYHFYLNADRTAITTVNKIAGLRAGLAFTTGPDGALYYIEGGGYQNGTLKRIVGPGGAPPPTATPAPAPTAPPTVPPEPSGRFFPETGQTVGGPFLAYWLIHGGLAQQGYPLSGEFQEKSDTDGKTYTVQYFERAVFERHPENQPPFDVLLSLLGVFRYHDKYPAGAPGQQPNTTPGSVLFAETGHRVGGVFLDYWSSHGGLAQQGYPISDEFMERSDLDGKVYRVQYFERAVFELHPENAPPYNVLLSQLGTYRYHARYPGR
jgi:glucose/arabinose dehydrogenase